MPPEQLRVLLVIDNARSLSMERLADALGTSGPATSRICKTMEAAGLLRRRPGLPGSGVILVCLTAAGRRLTARIREERRTVLDHVFQSLTPDGRRSLARGLSEFAASAL